MTVGHEDFEVWGSAHTQQTYERVCEAVSWGGKTWKVVSVICCVSSIFARARKKTSLAELDLALTTNGLISGKFCKRVCLCLAKYIFLFVSVFEIVFRCQCACGIDLWVHVCICMLKSEYGVFFFCCFNFLSPLAISLIIGCALEDLHRIIMTSDCDWRYQYPDPRTSWSWCVWMKTCDTMMSSADETGSIQNRVQIPFSVEIFFSLSFSLAETFSRRFINQCISLLDDVKQSWIQIYKVILD